MKRADVLIIGCGVSGLTTGVCLAEAGLAVRICTSAPAAETTSVAAGAIWGPYLVEPKDLVIRWSQRSLREFQDLSSEPGTGVRMTSGVEASREEAEAPPWAEVLAEFRRCEARDLPEGFADGFRFTVPLVDMPVYLDYLLTRFRSARGEIVVRTVHALADVAQEAPVTVNCAGIGARFLVPDPALHPVRGQLVVVENPGIEDFFSEDTGPAPDLTYVLPHGKTVVLGGTAEVGRWSLEPDLRTAADIVTRCSGIHASLATARVLGHRVGLRPTRATVRVGEETTETPARLLHNYGHGGGGVTLSWGCAQEIARAVLDGQQLTPAPPDAASS
jgi:D-amino-acid oxidase